MLAPALHKVIAEVSMNHRERYELEVLPFVPELSRAALRLTRSAGNADDLVQEALTRAWIGWAGFRRGSNARAWMHRILVNTFINHYRKHKRERQVLGELRGESGELRRREVHPTDGDLSDEVIEALAGLPAEFREAVTLVDLRELSYQEAAIEMACPVGTVMSRLHRARKALRGRLHDFAHAEGYVKAA